MKSERIINPPDCPATVKASACAPTIDENNPWPGLLPYDEASQAFFLGRDREAAELFRLIRLAPITALYGKSGLGKSSLLQAGLFPLLRKAHYLPVLLRVDFSEDAAHPPLEQIAQALEREISLQCAEAPARAPGQELWQYLHRTDFAVWSRDVYQLTPVIVLDQFEEVLEGSSAERIHALLDELGDLLDNRIPASLAAESTERSSLAGLDLLSRRYSVLLAFREDIIPEIRGWERKLPTLLRNFLRLEPLAYRQALEAVERAGQAVMESGAAKLFVDIVGKKDPASSTAEPDIEPVLLSLFGYELNLRRQPGHKIDRDLIERNKEDILKGFYERCVSDLSPEVRYFIEEKLLSGKGKRESVATETALTFGVTQEDIDLLVERRLIRKETRWGLERLELIHDRLTGIITDCRDLRRKLDKAAVELPMPYEGEEPYIFLSFSLQDSDALCDVDKINELGFRISYDREIYTGEEWKLRIGQSISGCSLFVVFVSQQHSYQVGVRDTFAWASDQKKRILPVFMLAPNQIKIDSKDSRNLLGRTYVSRYRFVDDMESYYAELTRQFPPRTRHCAEDRDCQILGIGELPEIRDIVNGKLSLTDDEKQQKHQREVQKILRTLRKTGSVAYSIETIFQLTAEETGAEENLSELPLRDPNKQRPSNLLYHPLNIGTAYIAPLRLVTGLITRLAENWPPLVTSYSRLVGLEKRDKLDELHYFVEFCWLAWGPSVLTTSLAEDKSSNFMVVQAAFGDEANSLPLIMKKGKWNEIVSAFQEFHDEHTLNEAFKNRREMGWPVHLENLLIVKPLIDPFFKNLCKHELLQNMFSQKSEDDPEKVALYLPSGDEEYPQGNVLPITEKQEAFYSTAYVWLMLEQDCDTTAVLTPGQVIPFFEHANLATSKGLKFLQHCLARKAIYHVLECESDPDYREKGYYRFATALFPEQMVNILEFEKKRLRPQDQKIMENRLKISHDPTTWRSASEVVRFADALSAQITNILKARGKR